MEKCRNPKRGCEFPPFAQVQDPLAGKVVAGAVAVSDGWMGRLKIQQHSRRIRDGIGQLADRARYFGALWETNHNCRQNWEQFRNMGGVQVQVQARCGSEIGSLCLVLFFFARKTIYLFFLRLAGWLVGVLGDLGCTGARGLDKVGDLLSMVIGAVI